jgi:diaminopimelate epimerase
MTLLLSPHWYRAHGLGNDYLVFEAAPPGTPGAWPLTPSTVQRVCHRWQGVGSDGIVVLLDRAPADGVFPLRMFNPDGSEFERSGNGLRILGSYLIREGLVPGATFTVRSGGSPMVLTRGPGATAPGVHDLSVEMGRARVGAGALGWVDDAAAPPDAGPHAPEVRGVVHPELGPLWVVGVSVGNPHAVVLGLGSMPWGDQEPLDGPLLDAIGPFLATHPRIPAGANVQLARPGVAAGVQIGIWERGVGRTSASGTSSCASTVALVALGLLPAGAHTVTMPGGRLTVTVTETLDVVLRGPVEEITTGTLAPGFVLGLSGAAGA